MTDHVTELRVLAARLEWEEVAASADVHTVHAAAAHIEALEATIETLREQIRAMEHSND